MDDVKAFLSFLAVEKKVSASSQNQAFNALLFLFTLAAGELQYSDHPEAAGAQRVKALIINPATVRE
jgi:hypothetical protein